MSISRPIFVVNIYTCVDADRIERSTVPTDLVRNPLEKYICRNS